MRNKILFSLSIIGIIAGLVSAYIYGMQKKPQPPVFNPAPNPYAKGIYANGIIESYQTNGENINIYPEVSGTITKILVADAALRLVQANYQAGIANYLQVLIADDHYHQAKIGYLQAIAQRFQDTVALFVALGGGWWNAEGKVPDNL